MEKSEQPTVVLVSSFIANSTAIWSHLRGEAWNEELSTSYWPVDTSLGDCLHYDGCGRAQHTVGGTIP